MMAMACLALAGGAGFVAAYLGSSSLQLKRGSRRALPSRSASLEKLLDTCGPLRDLRRFEELSRRKTERLKQLPLMLDILTLGLSAGLSFDASLELYCEQSQTGLAQSMREAMLSWRLGAKSRDQALKELADEWEVPAFKSFAASVSQALAFGAPLAETLERQAEAVREEQRSRIAEEIEKVPVKMLIPLGTLLVPAMLLAILGPLLGSTLGSV